MTMPEEDVRLFHRLLFALLDWANTRYAIAPGAPKLAGGASVYSPDSFRIGRHVWTHPAVIGEYLKNARDLSDGEREIVLGWERVVFDRFLVERHLKKGTAMLSLRSPDVYLVSGVEREWEDMVPSLPVLIEAGLIPFRDRIVCGGPYRPFPASFGGGCRYGFREDYREAGQKNRIFQSL